MDKRTWIIFAVAVVAVLAGLVLFSRRGAVDVSKVDPNKVITTQAQADAAGSGIPDRVFGTKDSKVVVIEYGDFSCPGCTQLHKNIRPVLDIYKDKVTYVFRNFPLTTIHPNSRVAAAYAEAAGMQGKYWEMHDALFNNRDSWWELPTTEREKSLDGFAKAAGVDMDKLKKDLQLPAVSKKIDFDIAIGKKAGVTATPTVYINGQLTDIDGKLDTTANITSTFNKALKDAGISTPADDKK